jgi:hypothetical protein
MSEVNPSTHAGRPEDCSTRKGRSVNSNDGETKETKTSPLSDLSALKLGTVLLTALTLLKAYAVAHFSLTTAGALLSSAPLAVLLGSTVQYLYVLLPLAAVGCLSAAAFSLFTTPKWQLWQGPAVVAAVAASLFSPWHFLWLIASSAAVVSVLLSAVGYVWSRHGGRRDFYRSAAKPTAVTFATVVFALMFVLTADKAWLPAEAISLREDALVLPVKGARARLVVGYVMTADAAGTTILVSDGRYVLHVPPGQVLHRDICHSEDQLAGRRPLYYAFKHRPYSSPNISCFRYRNG